MRPEQKAKNSERDETFFDRRKIFHDTWVLFAAAFLVRLIYLVESSRNPTFLMPIVDSQSYLDLARDMAAGAVVKDDLFWQPLFYPCFLAGMLRVFGESIWAIKIVQAIVGSLACVLVYLAGHMSLSRRAGIIAGAIMAGYGPLIFIEGELLGEGWAVFWIASLILLFVIAGQRDHPLPFALLGLCGAAAVLSRPPLLLFFLVGSLGFVSGLRRRMSSQQALVRLGIVATCFCIPLFWVARLNQERTGHYGFLPHSAGINLYVGNNPDWEQTVTARPGYSWREIYALPRRQGVTNVWEQSAFFQRQVLDYARSQPVAFFRGLLLKTARFFSSREIPRNVNVYMFREWSPTLALLTWRIGRFGFPFGVLLPLACLGVVLVRTRLPFPVQALLVLYPLVIILYFVSGRYRILMLPALALTAAAGLDAAPGWLRGSPRRVWKLGLAAAAITAASSLAPAFPEEQVNYRAEMYRALGFQLNQQEAYAESIPYFEKALGLQPDLVTALNDLSNSLLGLGRSDEALGYLERAVELSPQESGLHQNLGLLCLEQDRPAEAEQAFRRAIELEPHIQNRRFYLALCLAAQSRWHEALDPLREELAMSPATPMARELADEIEAALRTGQPPTGMRPDLKRYGILAENEYAVSGGK